MPTGAIIADKGSNDYLTARYGFENQISSAPRVKMLISDSQVEVEEELVVLQISATSSSETKMLTR
jgi:hypothetical protein